MDKFELTCDARGKVHLCHSMHLCIKEISKHEKHLTDETKTYTHQELTNLLRSVLRSASTMLNDNCSKNKDNIQKSNHEEESDVHLKSLCLDMIKERKTKD